MIEIGQAGCCRDRSWRTVKELDCQSGLGWDAQSNPRSRPNRPTLLVACASAWSCCRTRVRSQGHGVLSSVTYGRKAFRDECICSMRAKENPIVARSEHMPSGSQTLDAHHNSWPLGRFASTRLSLDTCTRCKIEQSWSRGLQRLASNSTAMDVRSRSGNACLPDTSNHACAPHVLYARLTHHVCPPEIYCKGAPVHTT